MAQWDGDGGFQGDYSDIPRLRWVGPGEPGTYANYRLGREEGPLQHEYIYSSPPRSTTAANGKALVLVNQKLYFSIRNRLDIYVADLEGEDYDVEVHTLSDSSAESLKAFIKSHSTDLRGCVLVGEFPSAWFEHDGWGPEEFPCDLFLMDLDGTWTDTDINGLYDEHTEGAGDMGPEIFIGHIDASMMSGTESEITNHYFDKAHAYRTEQFLAPGFGLTYTEDDWAGGIDIRTDIKYAYPLFEDIAGPETNRDDFIGNRVPNSEYEFIQLACHSNSFLHAFMRGGDLFNYQVKAAQPHAMFYNLFCCSTLRYTDPDFLGGCYIYDTSQTSLAVVGSTKTGSMLVFHAFYEPLGQYESFGEAFRQWFNFLAPYDSGEIAWHYGMTVIGDPFLSLHEPALYMDFPDGLPSGYYPPGLETTLTLEILSGSEEYIPGSGKVHYRFDPADPFSELTLTPLGNDLYQAVVPNTTPGDQPEFYFSILGDEGTTLLSPENAPAELYAFDVYFIETLLEDDFENASGWTVKNTGVLDGAWERADPERTFTGGNDVQPEDDHSAAGTQCFVTGPLAGSTVYSHDLDGGPTELISPEYDLSGVADAQFSFHWWFHHSTSGTQHPLEVHISNDGSQWIPVASLNHNPAWSQFSFKAGKYLTLNDRIQVRISASDNPTTSLVEALVDDFTMAKILFDPALWADGYAISAGTGAQIDFSLDAGQGNAGRKYLMLGSVSGTQPGHPLPGGQILPLNWDVFTDLVMVLLNTPACQNFLGTLNSAGEGGATLDTLGALDPAVVGVTAHFAYTLGGPFDFVSNAVPVDFEP